MTSLICKLIDALPFLKDFKAKTGVCTGKGFNVIFTAPTSPLYGPNEFLKSKGLKPLCKKNPDTKAEDPKTCIHPLIYLPIMVIVLFIVGCITLVSFLVFIGIIGFIGLTIFNNLPKSDNQDLGDPTNYDNSYGLDYNYDYNYDYGDCYH